MDRPSSAPPLDPGGSHGSAGSLAKSSSHNKLSRLIAGSGQRSRAGSVSAKVESAAAVSGVDINQSRGSSKGGRAAAMALLANDSRYKKYSQHIERTLATFDTVTEWADFISFLSRLHKALLSTSPPYHEIPYKLLISKRLAQGLNPALPNGVHQRTLEVYRDVFKLIGTDGLQRDFHIWSSGLFPFFQFASTAVRPAVLEIYETFYLALGAYLRSSTKAFQLALLPGMEEETGDFFDRVLRLFDRVSALVEESYFMQCIFLGMITSPSSRTAAVNYLAKRLPQRIRQLIKSQPPATAGDADNQDGVVLVDVIGPDGGLFIRALAAGLEDDNVLVRRGSLDLLNSCLPIEALTGYADFAEEDRELLMKAACAIVLRKDLSLSRRLFSWLLGSAEESEKQIEYLYKHALPLMTRALHSEMKKLSSPDATESTKPFRIFVSLLDKWEIGYPMSRELAYTAMMIAMEADSASASLAVRDNAKMVARAVFEAVEPYSLWSSIYGSIHSNKLHHALRLALWMIESFRNADEEVTNLHIPLVLRTLLQVETSDPDVEEMRIRLVDAMIKRLDWKRDKHRPGNTVDEDSIDQHISRYYTANATLKPPDFEQKHVPSNRSLLLKGYEILVQSATLDPPSALRHGILGDLLSVANTQGVVLPSNKHIRAWIEVARPRLQESRDYELVAAMTEVVLQLSQRKESREIVRCTLEQAIKRIFHFLSPAHLEHHSPAANLLWRLSKASSTNVVRRVIVETFKDPGDKRDAIQAFAMLWSTTDDLVTQNNAFLVPLCYLLECLHSPDFALRRVSSNWMRCDFKLYSSMLDILLMQVSDSARGIRSAAIEADGKVIDYEIWGKSGNLGQVTYIMHRIRDVVQHGGRSFINQMSSSAVRTGVLSVDEYAEGTTYRSALAEIGVKLLYAWQQTPTLPQTDTEKELHQSCLAIVRDLIAAEMWTATALSKLENAILPRLYLAISTADTEVQPILLDVLRELIQRQVQLTQATPAPIAEKAKDRQAVSLASTQGSADNGYLLQTILAAFNKVDNRPVLPEWLEFVLAIAAAMTSSVAPIFFAITDAICSQIARRLGDNSEAGSMRSDIPQLLQAAEAIVRLFADGSIPASAHPSTEPVGLFGYVSTVLGGEASSETSTATPIIGVMQTVQSVVSTAVSTFIAFTSESGQNGPNALQDAAESTLYRMYSWRPAETLGTICDNAVYQGTITAQDQIFEILDHLATSAHTLVKNLSDIVAPAIAEGDRTKSSTRNGTIDNVVVVLEKYIRKLEAPVATEVLPIVLPLVKSACNAPAAAAKKQLLVPVLRIYFSLLTSISTTSAFKDRRLRKDAFDTLTRLLEVTVANQSAAIPAGKSPKVGGGLSETRLLYEYLGVELLPRLREVIDEEDRVTNIVSLIMAGVVMPVVKQRPRGVPTSDPDVMRIIERVTHIQQAAKLWKPYVNDVFEGSGLFDIPRDERLGWETLLSHLISGEKERVIELLERAASTTSAANLFINREQENIQRSLAIRRVSLAITICPKNHYLVQLPQIQQRLVEILRTSSGTAIIVSEVHLCLRTILCRFPPQHWISFLPVILSEMLRVFEDGCERLPDDGSDGLTTLLSVCKLLDILLTLQSEEFQVYQWLFVTDTSDAIYPPSGYEAESLMERLANEVSERFHLHTKTPATAPLSAGNTAARRPQLAPTKSIRSVTELQPFFAQASMKAFETTYAGQEPDWTYIEQALRQEVFEK